MASALAKLKLSTTDLLVLAPAASETVEGIDKKKISALTDRSSTAVGPAYITTIAKFNHNKNAARQNFLSQLNHHQHIVGRLCLPHCNALPSYTTVSALPPGRKLISAIALLAFGHAHTVM
jgi:hypothetical protein